MLWTWHDSNQVERNPVDLYCIICICCESFPKDAANTFCTFILFWILPNGKWLVDCLRQLISIHYLIVGSGLYGAIFAHEAVKKGKKVLVIEKRSNIGGNIYTENVERINVHKYGAHIFHTNNKKVWNYITQFAEFNRFTNSPVANYKGELYSLPFNMYTFNKMWGVVTPEEAEAKIAEQRKEIVGVPKNLEEQDISLVGRDIYEKLIKGYTEKQWGSDCKELPAFIIRRLPVRFTFDNNYFNALYQGFR